VEKGLKLLGLRPTNGFSDEVWKELLKVDKNHNDSIELDEFKSYVKLREKKLRELFDSLDLTKDGFLHVDEVVQALGRYGVDASPGAVTPL
jgi:Ca2+-binding EF-hand superfamily protein